MQTHYTSGFAGRLHPHYQAPRTHSASNENLRSANTFTVGNLQLWVIGQRRSTQTFERHGGGVLLVKGRPFSEGGTTLRIPDNLSDIDRVLQKLDGRFALTVACEKEFVLATDLIGASAIYIHEGPNAQITFATHLGLLLELLPTRPTLSAKGVASVLFGSCIVGGNTHYKGIRRLEAGNLFHSSVSRAPIRRVYLAPLAALADQGVPDRSVEETLDALLVESVQRESRSGAGALMLSGGHDSQAVAHAWLSSKVDPLYCVTFGEWRSMDVRGARMFAAAADMPHRVVPYRRWSIAGYAPYVVGLTAGASGLQTAHRIVAYDSIRNTLPIAMVGYLGDALSGKHLPANGQDIVASVLPFSRGFHPSVMEFFSHELSEIDAELRDMAAGWKGLEIHQQAMLVDLLVREATWFSSTFDLEDWIAPLSFPFFHRRILRLFFNMPLQNLSGQSFYKKWLDRKATKLSVHGWDCRATLHSALDAISRRTGWFRSVRVCDWMARFRDEQEWLSEAVDSCPDPCLRKLSKIQLNAIKGPKQYLCLLVMLGIGLSVQARENSPRSIISDQAFSSSANEQRVGFIYSRQASAASKNQ